MFAFYEPNDLQNKSEFCNFIQFECRIRCHKQERMKRKKKPNVNFCGFCDLEFMIAHFVNRIQIKTTNINNNHLL